MRFLPHTSLCWLAQSAVCALALSQLVCPVFAQNETAHSSRKPRKPHPVKSANQKKTNAQVQAAATKGATVTTADPTAEHASAESPTASLAPQTSKLTGATPFKGDLRELPQTPPVKQERPKRKEPTPAPGIKDDPIERST